MKPDPVDMFQPESTVTTRRSFLQNLAAMCVVCVPGSLPWQFLQTDAMCLASTSRCRHDCLIDHYFELGDFNSAFALILQEGEDSAIDLICKTCDEMRSTHDSQSPPVSLVSRIQRMEDTYLLQYPEIS